MPTYTRLPSEIVTGGRGGGGGGSGGGGGGGGGVGGGGGGGARRTGLSVHIGSIRNKTGLSSSS